MSAISWNKQFRMEDSFAGLFKSLPSSHHRRSRWYDANIENLKTVIEYLTHLKNNQELTDKQFSALITRACAIFVENEMTSAINKVLIKPLKDFEGIFGVNKNEWR